MSVSRSDSAHHGRKRSNTAQSILRPIPQSPPVPVQLGGSRTLAVWVHDVKESSSVIFNRSCWPGVSAGDLLHLKPGNEEDGQGILFVVQKEEGYVKPQLQVSVPRPFAESSGLRNHGEAILTKVDKNAWSADYIEFTFQDQYLARNEMWRLQKCLLGSCVHKDQEILFIGSVTAKVQDIFIGGQKVSAAYVTPKTKVIYRSLSAKITIFIQVCQELWEFASDGERYNEKIVHSFLPELFKKWYEAGTNHTVTIVLISRVYYDPSETDYAAGPLRQDEERNWYKDFFKVITDLEVINEWKPTLVSLKDSFWDFQRDILLTHHYHRAALDTSPKPSSSRWNGCEDQQVRLVGTLSYAHDGPILEALNLALNPSETHYIDRSLTLTGCSTIIITPGSGYYRVNKHLLRLTTTRLLDQGFGVDLISLDKAPCHTSPIFSFLGAEPDATAAFGQSAGSRGTDPLWGGDDSPTEVHPKPRSLFWWEPFWMTVTFWDVQMDLPFRQDRFVARAKMHEIQMLGLLEHDVMSNIEVPLLPDLKPIYPPDDQYGSILQDATIDADALRLAADQFDNDRFASRIEPPVHKASFNISRSSLLSSSGGTVVPSTPFRSSLPTNNNARNGPVRTSIIVPNVPPIEESPHQILATLPPEGNTSDTVHYTSSLSGLDVVSSASSIRSNGSTGSKRTTRSTRAPGRPKRDTSTSRSSIASKLTPSWLFNPFRALASEPQTTSVSATASSSTSTSPSSATSSLAVSNVAHVLTTSPIRMPIKSSTTAQATISRSPNTRPPMPIGITGKTPANRSTLRQYHDDTSSLREKNTWSRRSPIGTPPASELNTIKRRSTQLSVASTAAQSFTSYGNARTNPCRPQAGIPEAQNISTYRWRHIFPLPLYKNEIKWKSMVYPASLPLTTEYFPSMAELESAYDMFSYDFVVDPRDMRSFMVRPNISNKASIEEAREACALAIMRGMAAVRLAQGFQFILAPGGASREHDQDHKRPLSRTKSFVIEDDLVPRAQGSAEILTSKLDPVYLSMSNEIHRILYTGEAIQVRRYVRRASAPKPFEYQCLIWPKLGLGYTEQSTTFTSHGLENFGWNRLDMLVAGYEQQFKESLRYWRTRFIVIPTTEPPERGLGQSDNLNDEEIRLLGIEKLAEHFSKLRWVPPDERNAAVPAVRFLPTTLDPSASVLDEALVTQLDEIHATGSLKKKMKSEKEIGEMNLATIAKAMREDSGLSIKHHQWHKSQYPDSFTGFDFVSWLVREFRDVSSRSQGAEWGVKLFEQGLFEHVRDQHGFLDGHYYYRLKGEYAVQMTPRGWFRTSRPSIDDGHPRSGIINATRPSLSPRRNRKRLILSQTMVIDIDPLKKSDQAESVILHHDIIHNPSNVFHFELHWVGTTARCIEEQVRQWNRTIERYGLKVVEAYVTQISDIRERNPFQSCFPVRLALPPPDISILERKLPEGSKASHYFEYAILRRFDFILDIEAADLYPEQIDVIYSYRRSSFRYSQFVHRSGLAFVQVVGGKDGFLYLTNRLMPPIKKGSTSMHKDNRLAFVAEDLRVSLHTFCQDEVALRKFYDEEVALLRHLPEEPPPLSI